MIKLIVGLSTIDDFAANQARYLIDFEGTRANAVITRHRPKRAEELMSGGSMYRVMKNTIMFRQRILGFEEIMHPEKGRMCLIACAPEIIRVTPTPKRPFQGWRYLQPDDTPLDLDGEYVSDDDAQAAAQLASELKAAGLV